VHSIQTTKLFEKDVIKAQKRGKDLAKLKFVINELVNNKVLPTKYKDHKLTGNYIGFKECHIEPDWLLVYKIANNILYLVRTGTHADLF
jgi:mRNA interferase YafQ